MLLYRVPYRDREARRKAVYRKDMLRLVCAFFYAGLAAEPRINAPVSALMLQKKFCNKVDKVILALIHQALLQKFQR